ncbi:MAG: cytochrome P450 [Proteobacteria bacterium]|nr:cytochrome P450 [Pseudomonadota bacterium]
MAKGIGDEYDMLDADSCDFFARARRDEPVFYSPKYDGWVICSYEALIQATKSPDKFSSASNVHVNLADLAPEVQYELEQGCPGMRTLFASDPPVHTRTRALVNQAFSPKRIATLEPIIRDSAHEFVDAFADKGQTDLINDFTYPLALLTICDLVGVPREEIDRFDGAAANYFMLVTPGIPVEEQIVRARAFASLQTYCEGMIEDRRRNPRDDYTTDLIQARVDGENALSHEQIVGELIAAALAGHEPTCYGVSQMMLHVLTTPGLVQRLRDEPELAGHVIEESIRLGIMNVVPRKTTTDVDIAGVTIPKDSWVFLAYRSGNWDEAKYPRPLELDLDRPEPKSHLGFGHGIHYCVGAPLARMQARLTLEVLLERLPNLRMQAGFKPTYEMTMQIGKLTHLPVEWDVQK